MKNSTKNDHWITGDGTTFPATDDGEFYAKKFAKKFNPQLTVKFVKVERTEKPIKKNDSKS